MNKINWIFRKKIYIFYFLLLLINLPFIALADDYLTCRERTIINQSKILTGAFIKNWIQPQKYKNEDISAYFRIILNENGHILKYYLVDVFCPADTENECEVFVQNVKETIKQTFPIAELKPLLSTIGEEYTLNFGSKEGNKILEDRKKDIKQKK